MQKIRAFLILILFATSCLAPMLASAQDASRGGMNVPPTFHMTGAAELLSNYVEHGVTQTNKNPALQGSFWFNFGPQARVGLWASNVSYPNESTTLVLKPSADVRIIFSPNTDFIVSYNENKYFSSSPREGNTLGLNLNTFGYRIKYQINNNWEGTHTQSAHVMFGKTYDVFGNWKWDNEAGYSMLKANGYNNYFDVRTSLGRSLGQVFILGGLTGTSASSQFANGSGGYFLILSASTQF